jgi:hypothetical protein
MEDDTAMRAIKAAKATFGEDKISVLAAAEKYEISKWAVSSARVIVEHGTAADITNLIVGQIGIKDLTDKIKEGLTPEEREKISKRQGTITDEHRKLLKADAELWAKLVPILHNFSAFPKPTDMVRVVKGNRMRDKTVANHIESTVNWIKEFYDEWLDASTKPDGGDSDA